MYSLLWLAEPAFLRLEGPFKLFAIVLSGALIYGLCMVIGARTYSRDVAKTIYELVSSTKGAVI
jgi:hypothetical protein